MCKLANPVISVIIVCLSFVMNKPYLKISDNILVIN